MAKASKITSGGVAQTRALIETWVLEADRKLMLAEQTGAATAAAYLKGRLDGYRDCLAALHQ